MLLLFSYLFKSLSLSISSIPSFHPPSISVVRSSSIYDSFSNQIITIGGFDPSNSQSIDQIISFNLTSQTFSKIFPVSKFDYGVASGHQIFLRKDRKIFIFGFMAGCYSFNLQSKEWKIEEFLGISFPQLLDFAGVQFERNGKEFVVVYGGRDLFQMRTDLFLFDLDDLVNLEISQKGERPGNRISASLVFYNDSIYLFGYDGINEFDSRLFKFDLNSETWEVIRTSGETPSSRISHRAHVYRNFMYVFFGVTVKNELRDDVFRFNFLDSTWSKLGSFPDLGRFSMQSVLIENQVFLLNGRGTTEIFNNILKFEIKENNVTFSQVTYNYKSPSERRFHCSQVINQYMYVYGGEKYSLNSEVTSFNDFWRFDLETQTWTTVTTSGKAPSIRSNFACTLVESNSITVFGGNEGLSYLNDLYFYYEPLSMWINLSPEGENLSPRSSSCLSYFNVKLYIIGGKNYDKGFNEIWVYTYESNIYYQLTAKNEIFKKDLHDCHSWVEESADSQVISIIVTGGKSFDSHPNMYIYNLTVNNQEILEIHSNLLKEPIKSKSSIISFENKILIIGGFIYDSIVSNPLILLDLSTLSTTILEFDSKIDSLSLQGHSSIHYKNSIFIFGGTSSTDYLSSFITSNNLLKLSFEPSDPISLPCSPGTSGENCLPCKAGTFYNNGKCDPCPKGTFSEKISLISMRQCLPCNYGEYSDTTGTVSCKECPSYSECPLGSSSLKSKYKITANQTSQPSQYKKNIETINKVLKVLWYLVLGIGILSFMIFFSFSKFRRVLKKIDLFVDGHEQDLEVPVIYKKTITGGVFSLGFYLVALVTFVNSCLVMGFDNLEEFRALVPLITLDEDVVSEQMIFNFTMYMYGDKCVHNESFDNFLVVVEDGFEYSQREQDSFLVDGNCFVSLKYRKFKINKKKAVVFVQMRERQSFASALTCSVTSNSSIPGQVSSISTSISTANKFVAFRGVNPSEFYFKFIPSVFKLETSSETKTSTGFHVFSDQEPVQGGQFPQKLLYSQIYLFFKVVIFESDTAMETKRIEKQTFFNFIGALMGSIFGLMGTFEAILGLSEGFVDRYLKFRKKRRIVTKCLNQSRKLGFEFGRLQVSLSTAKVFPVDVFKIKDLKQPSSTDML